MLSIRFFARPTILVINCTILTLVSLGVALADDWPQWRGPRRDGVSLESGLLAAWPSGGPRLAWKSSNIGIGYASVIVSRGRVFTIGRHDRTVLAMALDEETGRTVWTKEIGSTDRNPSSTPTADRDVVYALDPDGNLVCLRSADGQLVWKRHLRDEFNGQLMSSRGYGESPLIDAERLICTPGNANAALVSLNKATGDEVWRSKTPELGPLGKDGGGFSSVVVTAAAGVRQYVQLMGRGLVGVRATDGEFLWGFNGIANTNANIPTPIVKDDYVFSANGYTAGSVLLKLVADDGSSRVRADVVYSLNGSQFQNHHGGIVRLGNFVYGGHGNNNGLPTCVDLETGRIVWKKRGPGVGSAAIVYADGHLYFRYQNGLVALIEPGPRNFELKGTFEIQGAGGDSWAHPVVANGRLYLREQDNLWVYDVRRDSSTVAPTTEEAPLSSSPAIANLKKRGVKVELVRIQQIAPRSHVPLGKERRLLEYAVSTGEAGGVKDQGATQKTRPDVIYVELSDSTLTPQGSIDSDVIRELAQIEFPLFLSLVGTNLSDRGLQQICAELNPVGLNLELCGELTDRGLGPLRSLKSLKVLGLSGTKITNAGLAEFRNNTSLLALDLELCDGVADESCEVLGSIKFLKALILKKSGFELDRVSDSGLIQLQSLSKLEVLNLYGNKVTDAGLEQLHPLQKLRELDLSLLVITDLGLPQLKNLKALERLELLYSEGFAGPKLTNAVTSLVEMAPNLRRLNLTGAKLTDEGLVGLAGLRRLQQLQVARTGVTPAGIETFRKLMPECEVTR